MLSHFSPVIQVIHQKYPFLLLYTYFHRPRCHLSTARFATSCRPHHFRFRWDLAPRRWSNLTNGLSSEIQTSRLLVFYGLNYGCDYLWLYLWFFCPVFCAFVVGHLRHLVAKTAVQLDLSQLVRGPWPPLCPPTGTLTILDGSSLIWEMIGPLAKTWALDSTCGLSPKRATLIWCSDLLFFRRVWATLWGKLEPFNPPFGHLTGSSSITCVRSLSTRSVEDLLSYNFESPFHSGSRLAALQAMLQATRFKIWNKTTKIDRISCHSLTE